MTQPLSPLSTRAQPVWIVADESQRGTTANNAAFTQFTPGAVDAVGRVRMSQAYYLFNSLSAYDAEPLIWQTMVSGAGATATWNTANRSVILALANVTGYVIRQTYQYISYQAGRSQLITMTGISGEGVANVTKRWGLFDARNGVGFAVTGAGVRQVFDRYNGGDASVNQSNWNLDKLDGTGPSGVNLDFTKEQFCVIDFAWQGVAPIRYGFLLNGGVVYCHRDDHTNLITHPWSQTAFLPLRYELISTANATAQTEQMCTAVSSEGGTFSSPGSLFAGGRTIAQAISTAGAEVPLVAIRPAVTYGTLPNRIFIIPRAYDVIGVSGAIGYRVLYYPPGSADPITGGAWAAMNANSATEINIGGTALSLTGAIEIDSGYVGTSGGSARGQVSGAISLGYPFTLNAAGAGDPRTTNVGASPAFLVVSGLGAGASSSARITVEEVR